MICSNCGKELEGENVFCPYCGKKIEVIKKQRFCPACGDPVTNENQKFCEKCGAKLEEPAPVKVAETVPTENEGWKPSSHNELAAQTINTESKQEAKKNPNENNKRKNKSNGYLNSLLVTPVIFAIFTLSKYGIPNISLFGFGMNLFFGIILIISVIPTFIKFIKSQPKVGKLVTGIIFFLASIALSLYLIITSL